MMIIQHHEMVVVVRVRLKFVEIQLSILENFVMMEMHHDEMDVVLRVQ